MRVRWLGWAGVEIESEGDAVVIDPLDDTSATFAALGERAADVKLPRVIPPRSEGQAAAGLLTHLHRDHADAGALWRALATDAVVYEPVAASGGDDENLGLAQAQAELHAAGLERRSLREWEQVEAGPFTLTALPAVDGAGDPQISWLVEADDRRVIHLGDTMFHGYWWRIAKRLGPFDVVLAPINGAVLRVPHMRPASPLGAALDPEQAALAGELLGARTVVPIHYDGYEIEPWYRPVPDAAARFIRAAEGRPYEARVLEVGESVAL
jgi:L-ascorbate metabolism protein UlaG (beta-lactamase superfamily)